MIAAAQWMEAERQYPKELNPFLRRSPKLSGPGFILYTLLIPARALVYLGNSLPIREWDLAAILEQKYFQVGANRGMQRH